jgi:serine protease
MFDQRYFLPAALVASAAFWGPLPLLAAEQNPVAREPQGASVTGQLDLITKLRPDTAEAGSRKISGSADRGVALAARLGLAVEIRREISAELLATRVATGDLDAHEILRRMRADPEVEYVVPDVRRYPHATSPNDALFAGQWYLQASQPSAVNAIGAWDTEVGTGGVVVAVLDTGVLYDHPDLGRADAGGKLLPGHDFVTDAAKGNDGNGRDADPSDPGDWVNDADKTGTLANCEVSGSSWHGTRVAGVIGALSNNASGVAGLSWNSLILPVRVLGKCGGTDSDILAGMRWAAGLPVPGIPTNPTPARVLNLSLGSSGPCQASYRDVIAELTARKVLVVISAGNEGTVVSSPGNCAGVAAIAAIRHAGSKVGFSSLGPEVALAAPGGNCVNLNGGPCLFSLDTTSNSGTTQPAAHIFTDQVNSNLGTSFSAPIVSGIAALMLARNHNLSTAQLLARLREGARPFPTTVADAPDIESCRVPLNAEDFQLEQCLCTTSTCGAGMASAANSVAAADRPIAAIVRPNNVSAGQPLTLNASGSAAACGRTLVSHQWSVVEPAVNPPTVIDADAAVASVLAPATGSITLRLTATDNMGRTDSADLLIGTSSASTTAPASAGTSACAAPVTSGPTPRPGSADPTPTPPSPPAQRSSGGGGGGAFGPVALTLLGLLLGRTRNRRRRIVRCI